MKLFSKIVGFFSGSKVLEEWLGDSCRPVPKQEAISRAKMCETCPNNMPVGGLTDAAAKSIEKWVAIKNKQKLTVPNEDKLNYCIKCYCKLSLKIFVPHEYIKQYQKSSVEDAIRATKPECWQL